MDHLPLSHPTRTPRLSQPRVRHEPNRRKSHLPRPGTEEMTDNQNSLLPHLRTSRSHNDTVFLRLSFNSHFTGMLVGTGGSTIQRLRLTSGVSIEIEDEEVNVGPLVRHRIVEIHGRSISCMDVIQQMVEVIEQKRSVRPNEVNEEREAEVSQSDHHVENQRLEEEDCKNDDSLPLSPLTSTASTCRSNTASKVVRSCSTRRLNVSLNFLLPPIELGSVIGGGASVMKQIQRQTGARLFFHQNVPFRGHLRLLVITSRRSANVDSAMRMVVSQIASVQSKGPNGPNRRLTRTIATLRAAIQTTTLPNSDDTAQQDESITPLQSATDAPVYPTESFDPLLVQLSSIQYQISHSYMLATHAAHHGDYFQSHSLYAHIAALQQTYTHLHQQLQYRSNQFFHTIDPNHPTNTNTTIAHSTQINRSCVHISASLPSSSLTSTSTSASTSTFTSTSTSASSVSPALDGSTAPDPSLSDSSSLSLHIPTHLLTRLIGQNGSTINFIRQDSKAVIHIENVSPRSKLKDDFIRPERFEQAQIGRKANSSLIPLNPSLIEDCKEMIEVTSSPSKSSSRLVTISGTPAEIERAAHFIAKQIGFHSNYDTDANSLTESGFNRSRVALRSNRSNSNANANRIGSSLEPIQPIIRIHPNSINDIPPHQRTPNQTIQSHHHSNQSRPTQPSRQVESKEDQ